MNPIKITTYQCPVCYTMYDTEKDSPTPPIIQLSIRTDRCQLMAVGEGRSLHTGLPLGDKFLSCVDDQNCISHEDWYRWLSR